MIASINKTNEILNKYNLRAKKGLGQNFLIDSNIVNKICETAKIDKKTGVIEIGPGIGAMTEVLVSLSSKVLCYEIDSDMIEVLENEIKSDNLKLVHADFLKTDIINDLKYFSDVERIIVVSNLPYYITTPIIFKLLDIEEIKEIFIMIQKEVAMRLTASVSTKDYGSLSVIIKYLTECKYEFNVGRNCFCPVPNVDSGLVSIKRVKRDYGVNNSDKFKEFIKDIFAMRRKTLVNNLLSKYEFSRDKITQILSDMTLDINVRSESLDLDKIVELYKNLFQ